uniref:Uncharacterized protein n=1 Tax=Meloidogyne enterolobii TaxID=390850 RepID=A0A6V7V2U6_MELEN|nr:unnamed protein product [Meloidogyne enterolobii]
MNSKIAANILLFVLINLLINIEFMDCNGEKKCPDGTECPNHCCKHSKNKYYCCVTVTACRGGECIPTNGIMPLLAGEKN